MSFTVTNTAFAVKKVRRHVADHKQAYTPSYMQFQGRSTPIVLLPGSLTPNMTTGNLQLDVVRVTSCTVTTQSTVSTFMADVNFVIPIAFMPSTLVQGI